MTGVAVIARSASQAATTPACWAQVRATLSPAPVHSSQGEVACPFAKQRQSAASRRSRESVAAAAREHARVRLTTPIVLLGLAAWNASRGSPASRLVWSGLLGTSAHSYTTYALPSIGANQHNSNHHEHNQKSRLDSGLATP